MENEKFLTTIHNLETFLGKQKNNITNHIISENVANGMCKEIDYTVNESFEQLFGNANNLSEKGVLDTFNYSSTNYKYAVMLSYFNFVKDLTKENEYRENPFYKGRRWSKMDGDSIPRENFYFFFDILKEYLDSKNVPVLFLIKKFIGKTNYLKVTSNKWPFQDISDSSFQKEFCEITFPMFDEKSDTNFPEFTIYIEMILKFKRDYLNFIAFNKNELILEEKEKIHNEIKEKTEKVVKEFNEYLKTNSGLVCYVRKLKEEISGFTDSSCAEIDVFKVLLLYQFYDIPYIMHFFLPNIEMTNIIGLQSQLDDNYCSLAFSTEINYFFSDECITFWKRFIDVIEKISCLKEDIWKKVNVKLQNDWKKYFEKNIQNYELLSSAAKNIFIAICKSENIDAQVTSRVKSFDSLYNKLVNRANGRDPDFPSNDFDEKFGKTFFNREDRIEYYKTLINRPSKENVPIVFDNIKDIVGIRIICKFENDVERFHLLFYNTSNDSKTDIKENYGLELNSHKKYMVKREETAVNDRGYYYTSNHYTYKLSETRKKLVEFGEISDIIFELQVRTTLSQGVSDVSHDIYYKTNLPETLNEKLRKLAENANIKKYSWDLADIDREFSKLKNQYEKFKEKFIEYIE